jgi:nucleotide-binding universal stress UspA family protein
MHRFRHLSVALSGTERDAGLIRYAAALARLGAAVEVRFVHVLPPSGPARHDEALAAVRAAAGEHFVDVPQQVRVFHDVLKGPLLDRLLTFTAEQEVDLLLVGHRTEDPERRALARRLAMKAPCSVWMVPDGSEPEVRRILVPVDFSDHAADALAVATSLARLVGLPEVLALHVYFDEARVTYEEADQVLRGQEREAFERFVAPLNLRGVAVRPLFVESSHVAAAILRTVEEQRADVTVMATRGRSASASILLGSVTEGVLLEAHRPVLAVKHYGARLSLLGVLLDRSFWRRKGPQFD